MIIKKILTIYKQIIINYKLKNKHLIIYKSILIINLMMLKINILHYFNL